MHISRRFYAADNCIFSFSWLQEEKANSNVLNPMEVQICRISPQIISFWQLSVALAPILWQFDFLSHFHRKSWQTVQKDGNRKTVIFKAKNRKTVSEKARNRKPSAPTTPTLRKSA